MRFVIPSVNALLAEEPALANTEAVPRACRDDGRIVRLPGGAARML